MNFYTEEEIENRNMEPEDRAEQCGCRGQEDQVACPDCGPHPPEPERRPPDLDKVGTIGLLRHCGHVLHRGPGTRWSQDRILWILSDHDGMSQKKMMELLRIQPGSMSEILSKLESGGYLVRERDEQDRRRVILRITESGRIRAHQRKQDNEKEVFAGLTQEEQETLTVLLRKLIRGWQEQKIE